MYQRNPGTTLLFVLYDNVGVACHLGLIRMFCFTVACAKDISFDDTILDFYFCVAFYVSKSTTTIDVASKSGAGSNIEYENSVYLNIDDSKDTNELAMQVGETFRLRAFRAAWEIVFWARSLRASSLCFWARSRMAAAAVE